MDAKTKKLILDLCDKVDEVVENGDWPTTEGKFVDDGVNCTCPLDQLTRQI